MLLCNPFSAPGKDKSANKTSNKQTCVAADGEIKIHLKLSAPLCCMFVIDFGQVLCMCVLFCLTVCSKGRCILSAWLKMDASLWRAGGGGEESPQCTLCISQTGTFFTLLYVKYMQPRIHPTVTERLAQMINTGCTQGRQSEMSRWESDEN